MEPKSSLNRVRRSGLRSYFLIALSVMLLYGRLATLYAPMPPAVKPAKTAVSSAPVDLPQRHEDGELFDRALATGLLRTDRAGRIVIAPADLPLRRRWVNEHPELVVSQGNEPDWLAVSWNDEVSRWHRALHFSASGRYVRQQIDLFNAGRPEFPHIHWQAGRLSWRERP